MVSGINHVTLAVRDLDVSIEFYSDLLGLNLVARWSKGAYLTAGNDWITLTLDPNTRANALPEYTHIAFTIPQAEFTEMSQRLRGARLEVWQENRSPGHSIYFLDPNGHKLEIHSSDLPTRLAELAAKPPAGLVFFTKKPDRPTRRRIPRTVGATRREGS